jgi:hypothetical protein
MDSLIHVHIPESPTNIELSCVQTVMTHKCHVTLLLLLVVQGQVGMRLLKCLLHCRYVGTELLVFAWGVLGEYRAYDTCGGKTYRGLVGKI